MLFLIVPNAGSSKHINVHLKCRSIFIRYHFVYSRCTTVQLLTFGNCQLRIHRYRNDVPVIDRSMYDQRDMGLRFPFMLHVREFKVCVFSGLLSTLH